jgi:small subunit ribosomal protein S24e
MKIKIASEKENPLMERKELVVDIDHDKECTPTKAHLQVLLGKELKKDPEHIDIRNIFSGYGHPKSKSKVFVWNEKKVEDLSRKITKEAPESKKDEPKEAAKKEDSPKDVENRKEPEKKAQKETKKEGQNKEKSSDDSKK